MSNTSDQPLPAALADAVKSLIRSIRLWFKARDALLKVRKTLIYVSTIEVCKRSETSDETKKALNANKEATKRENVIYNRVLVDVKRTRLETARVRKRLHTRKDASLKEDCIHLDNLCNIIPTDINSDRTTISEDINDLLAISRREIDECKRKKNFSNIQVELSLRFNDPSTVVNKVSRLKHRLNQLEDILNDSSTNESSSESSNESSSDNESTMADDIDTGNDETTSNVLESVLSTDELFESTRSAQSVERMEPVPSTSYDQPVPPLFDEPVPSTSYDQPITPLYDEPVPPSTSFGIQNIQTEKSVVKTTKGQRKNKRSIKKTTQKKKSQLTNTKDKKKKDRQSSTIRKFVTSQRDQISPVDSSTSLDKRLAAISKSLDLQFPKQRAKISKILFPSVPSVTSVTKKEHRASGTVGKINRGQSVITSPTKKRKRVHFEIEDELDIVDSSHVEDFNSEDIDANRNKNMQQDVTSVKPTARNELFVMVEALQPATYAKLKQAHPNTIIRTVRNVALPRIVVDTLYKKLDDFAKKTGIPKRHILNKIDSLVKECKSKLVLASLRQAVSFARRTYFIKVNFIESVIRTAGVSNLDMFALQRLIAPGYQGDRYVSTMSEASARRCLNCITSNYAFTENSQIGRIKYTKAAIKAFRLLADTIGEKILRNATLYRRGGTSMSVRPHDVGLANAEYDIRMEKSANELANEDGGRKRVRNRIQTFDPTNRAVNLNGCYVLARQDWALANPDKPIKSRVATGERKTPNQLFQSKVESGFIPYDMTNMLHMVLLYNVPPIRYAHRTLYALNHTAYAIMFKIIRYAIIVKEGVSKGGVMLNHRDIYSATRAVAPDLPIPLHVDQITDDIDISMKSIDAMYNEALKSLIMLNKRCNDAMQDQIFGGLSNRHVLQLFTKNTSR